MSLDGGGVTVCAIYYMAPVIEFLKFRFQGTCFEASRGIIMQYLWVCLDVHGNWAIGLFRPIGFFFVLYEDVLRVLLNFLVMFSFVKWRAVMSGSSTAGNFNGRYALHYV